MRTIPEVGDVVNVSQYYYRNKNGGTGGPGPAATGIKVTKAWEDYEIGWRYHGTWVKQPAALPDDADPQSPIFFGDTDVTGCQTCDESQLDEFTGVSGIPALEMPGLAPANPAKRLLRKRKRSAVHEFLTAKPEVELADELPVVAPAVAITAPVAEATVLSTPAVQPPSTVTVDGALGSTLLITREIAEALSAGQSVSCRGVWLQPTFKAVSRRVESAPADVAAATAAIAAVVQAPEPLTEATGTGLDLHAAQPPPPPPSDGKRVTEAFRRFGPL